VGYDGDDADRHGRRYEEPSPNARGKDRYDVLARHGLPVAGVDIRIVDEFGVELPWDGATMGELQVRGPWVTSSYYNDPRGDEGGQKESFMDGWFRTGDVATIDAEGYIQIMDRTKDLVKSGGEWISSVDLENAIMAHPKVMEAAVIAVPHPSGRRGRWPRSRWRRSIADSARKKRSSIS